MGKISEDLSAFSARHKTWRDQMRQEGQAQFNKVIKDVFDKYEFLNAISWKQYTPYYNDGETCEFGVDEPYFIISKVERPEDLPRELEFLDDNEDDETTIKFPFELPDYYYTSKYYKREVESYKKGLEIVGSQLQEATEDLIELSRFIQDSEDVMLSLFDDHVTVTIYRTENGIETDATEYDHD